MIQLKKRYIQVDDKQKISFGGNQAWFSEKKLSDFGCGLVASGDILLYLTKTGRIKSTAAELVLRCGEIYEKEVYLNYLRGLEKKYFYVSRLIRGITGFGLAIGFNRFDAGEKSAFKASWGVPVSRIGDVVRRSLEKDIPVLFSVGANFPWVFGKKGVTLYEKQDGIYKKSTQTRKHYMTITGIEQDDMLGELYQISSWGREYYMSRHEYEEYIHHYSIGLLTNILFIREKKK